MASRLFSGRLEGPGGLHQLSCAIVEIICRFHAGHRRRAVHPRPWGSMPKQVDTSLHSNEARDPEDREIQPRCGSGDVVGSGRSQAGVRAGAGCRSDPGRVRRAGAVAFRRADDRVLHRRPGTRREARRSVSGNRCATLCGRAPRRPDVAKSRWTPRRASGTTSLGRSRRSLRGKSVLGPRSGPLRSDGTTAATRKSCPPTKTRLPPGAGSGRRSLVLGVGACEGRAEPLELLPRQCLLDHREEVALLVADVALEALAKLAKLRRIRVPASL
jgi:hypothetical protein